MEKIDIGNPPKYGPPFAAKMLDKTYPVYSRPEKITEFNQKDIEKLDPYDQEVMGLQIKWKAKRDKAIQAMYDNDDVLLSVCQIITKYGYPYERLFYDTEDGFYLIAFRISGGKGARPEDIYKTKKPVVVMQHGMLDCADGFICQGAESLPFRLADQGNDVWLLNSRANRHCRNHRYHDWHEAEFWDYSFEKMGELDLPAGIDFILNKTKQEQLTYIGHSQGSTSLFAGMCLKPQYFKDKIRLFIAVAPVIRITNLRS